MNKKQVGAWALFDLANSVYPAVITAVVFQVYYINTVVGNTDSIGDWWWGRAVSLSALIVAVSSPLLGAIADRVGMRKRFMAFFVAMCLTGVALFTTLGPGAVAWGFTVFVFANVGYEACLVFYNAYLPDIAPSDKQGWVSGLGFGVGYAGSAVGLLLAIPLIETNIDLVWIMVAVFFIIFSIPSFLFLPQDQASDMSVGQAARWGVTNFREILGEVLQERDLRRFLLAFFFYIDGVLTAIYMSSTVASTTFGYTQNELVSLYIALQIAALIGSFVLAKPTDLLGPKKILSGVLVMWTLVAVSIGFIPTSKLWFGALAMVAGFGLGSVQAASRAFMAALIPKGKEAEMFGFYALCGKSSSIVGPLAFGYIAVASGGNQRLAVMALSVLFIVGLGLLRRVNDPRAAT
ncbi:MAG: MFS transporter [Gammaproteobacteria bacterium]|nr:MAG: MFS transporter [Gammaproteobacteria bacterium]